MTTAPAQSASGFKPLPLRSGGNICIATIPPAPPASTQGLENWASGAFTRRFDRRFEGRVLADLNWVRPRTVNSELLAMPRCDPRKGSIAVRVTLRIDKAQDRYVIDVSARAGSATYADHLEREHGSQWRKDKLRYVDDPGPGFDHWRYGTQNAVTIDASAMADKLARSIILKP